MWGLLVMVIVVSGCEAADSVGDGGVDAGSAGSGGGGGGTGGAGGGGSGGGQTDGAAGGGGSGVKGGGAVLVTSALLKNLGLEFNHVSASAAFSPPAAQAPSTPCTRSTEGPCLVQDCTIPTGAADAGAPPAPARSPHAGTITVKGSLRQITLSPGAEGGYPAFMDSEGLLWRGGETVMISGAGAEVPAFSHSLTGPGNALVSSPTPAGDGTLTISRAGGLTLRWTEGGGGNLVLTLSQAPGGSRSLIVICGFPAAAGMGVIPPAALQGFSPGEGFFGGTVQTLTTIDVSGWAVLLSISSSPRHPDTGSFQGRALFQ